MWMIGIALVEAAFVIACWMKVRSNPPVEDGGALAG
jgi:hypothetical protein